MPLPGGATGFTLSGGPYDDPSFEGMTAKLTTNVPVTHLATGERLRRTWTVTVDYSGSFTVGPLPFSDDPAFTPNGFQYTLTWQALSYKDTPGNLTFAVPQSAGATVDFDTLAAATPGQPALPTTVFSVNGHTGAVTLAKADVGLGSVDNTADTAKPVSTAMQTALAAKANIADIGVSGTPAGDAGRAAFGLSVAATVSASATLAVGKFTPVDATAAARTMTLPTGAADGVTIGVEKVDASTNTVSVTGNIRGSAATTITLPWQHETLLLRADAAGSWWPVAGHKTKASLDATYATSDLLTSRKFRRQPRRTMVTTFQAGHGWTANVGTWTADTTDFRLGSQSIKTTTAGNGIGNTFRKLGLPALDLTNRNCSLLVKVDQPVNLFQLQLYVGSGSLANFAPLIAGSGGAIANTTIPPGEWTWINFGLADAGNLVGTFDKTAVTDWQFRVVDTNAAAPVTVWCNAVAHYPKRTLYPSGVVSIAFDDSYDNQFTQGAPILDALGIGATAFTIVEALDTAGKMTTAQLNQLQDVHGWEVAGHAMTFAAHNAGFSTLSAASLESEVRGLRDWLRRNQHKGADLFAYPLGDENATVRQSVGNYFSLARQIVRVPQLTQHIDQPLRLRSYSVSSSDTLASVQGQVDKATANGSWLVLTFHRLVPGAPAAGTEWKVSDFQSLISYIDGKGMAVETVGQVLDTLR